MSPSLVAEVICGEIPGIGGPNGTISNSWTALDNLHKVGTGNQLCIPIQQYISRTEGSRVNAGDDSLFEGDEEGGVPPC